MTMICPKCGSENPDHVFYCGKCAEQLKGVSPSETEEDKPRKVRPAVKIESILSRNLLRIEENVRKWREKGFLARFRGPTRRPQIIMFTSEVEKVVLIIDSEGHASVSKTPPSKPGIELSGPHESFLSMFEDERNLRGIPGSISIHIRGSELPMHDEMTEILMREVVEKVLRSLFE
jgi:hypothetical protein